MESRRAAAFGRQKVTSDSPFGRKSPDTFPGSGPSERLGLGRGRPTEIEPEAVHGDRPYGVIQKWTYIAAITGEWVGYLIEIQANVATPLTWRTVTSSFGFPDGTAAMNQGDV